MTDIKFAIDDLNPPAIARKIALKMKTLRISRNLTQVALANKSGVSLGSIKRFESKHEIAFQSLIRIALVLDALEEFHQLFSMSNYGSIDDVFVASAQKTRKRARNA